MNNLISEIKHAWFFPADVLLHAMGYENAFTFLSCHSGNDKYLYPACP